MKDWLKEIPVMVKVLGTAVTLCAAAIMWMFSTFETSASSELKWTQHNQALQCRTVYSLQKELREAMEKRHRATSAEDKAYYDQQIQYLQAEIKRIDPDGVC